MRQTPRWQSDYLPVYAAWAAWAAIVVVVFPPLFRFMHFGGRSALRLVAVNVGSRATTPLDLEIPAGGRIQPAVNPITGQIVYLERVTQKDLRAISRNLACAFQLKLEKPRYPDR